MKTLTSVLLLGSALALSACGGDSDSSGSNTTTTKPATPTQSNEPTKPNQPTKPTKPAKPKDTCKVEGSNVYVPKEGSCTFTIEKVNDGVQQTYQCSGGYVSLGTISAGGALNFGGYSIKCAS